MNTFPNKSVNSSVNDEMALNVSIPPKLRLPSVPDGVISQPQQ